MNSTHFMFQHLTHTILEILSNGLGIKKCFAFEDDNFIGLLRSAKYNIPKKNDGASLRLLLHVDKSVFSFICQNEVQGLEIGFDGEWSELVIPDGSLLFLGDVFKVWSNGRFCGLKHKVMIKGERDTYSYSCFVSPSDEAVIEVPPELVDDEHSRLYRSFTYKDYIAETALKEGSKVLGGYAGI